MANQRWDQEGLPHKGWAEQKTIDLNPDGRADEAAYETCEMCGNERIRFVHVMVHDAVPGPLRVGSVCAGKMTDDYEAARRREERLRSRAGRQKRWLSRAWRQSQKGNPFINVDGHNVGIHRTRGGWGYRIDDRFGTRSFASSDEAKLALFDELSPPP